jgi:hypothetical protein
VIGKDGKPVIVDGEVQRKNYLLNPNPVIGYRKWSAKFSEEHPEEDPREHREEVHG